MQMFHWTRNPATAAKIAARKEELYSSMMNGVSPAEVPGSRAFLQTLRSYGVPLALATPQPERRVQPALERLGLTQQFDAVVTAEDNGAPEVCSSSRAPWTRKNTPAPHNSASPPLPSQQPLPRPTAQQAGGWGRLPPPCLFVM